MKLLTRSLGSFLTGTEIADAALDYGLILTRERRSDIIDVPFRTETGDVQRLRIIVGWMVELATITQPDDDDELVDVDAVTAIRSRTDAIRRLASPGTLDRASVDRDWFDVI